MLCVRNALSFFLGEVDSRVVNIVGIFWYREKVAHAFGRVLLSRA